MKVKHKTTGQIFYIWDTDKPKIGKPENVPVFDHEPWPGGCEHLRFGNIEMFRCGRKKSQPIKIYKGDWLEIVEGD